MNSLCSSPKPSITTFLQIPHLTNEHIFNAYTRTEVQIPSVILIAEDENLVFGLPQTVLKGYLTVTTFDLCVDKIYETNTKFPIPFQCKIEDGIYFSKHLYIYGYCQQNSYFVCRFHFNKRKWKLILQEQSDHSACVLKCFIPKNDGVTGIFNFSDRRLTILNIKENTDFSFVHCKTTNNPPPRSKRALFDGEQSLWMISLDDKFKNNIAQFNISTLTWLFHPIYNNTIIWTKRSTVDYCSGFVRDHMITYFVPFENGTYVCQINLQSVDVGWLPTEFVSEVIVSTKPNWKSDQLYGLRIKVHNNEEIGSFISILSWTFSVPKLETLCLKVIMKNINTTKFEPPIEIQEKGIRLRSRKRKEKQKANHVLIRRLKMRKRYVNLLLARLAILHKISTEKHKENFDSLSLTSFESLESVKRTFKKKAQCYVL